MKLFGHGGGVLLKGSIQIGTEIFGEFKAREEFDDTDATDSMTIHQVSYLAPDNSTYYEVLSKDYCVVMHFDEDWEGRLKHGGNIND